VNALYKVAIVNELPGNLRELGLIREALEIFGAQVSASYRGLLPPPQIELLTKGQPCPLDAMPFYARTTSSVRGAAGYHDETDDGLPFAELALDAAQGGEFLRTMHGDSFLATFQHELAEAMLNLNADTWVQAPFTDRKTGRVYSLVAKEACDPTQEISDTMKLSDGTVVDRIAWVLPNFWNPRRIKSEPVDSHGALSDPLTLAPGGYQIAATIGREVNVFGKLTQGISRSGIIEDPEHPMSEKNRVRKLGSNSRTMKILRSIAA
jgi:hypothetical protein